VGSKSILFISDMHDGSIFGVCSPNPLLRSKGTEWKPNKLQKQLYRYWLKVKDSLSKRPFLLCVNGEPIEGPNSKQMGKDVWSTDINDQKLDVVSLLKELNPENFVMTRGSGYHTTTHATNQEEALAIDLAKELNCIPYSTHFGRYIDIVKDYDENRNKTTRTDYHLLFSVNDRVFSVTHHIGFSRWFAYLPSALGREMAEMEFLKGKYWKNKDHPTFTVRSHTHHFVLVRYASSCGFVTPAWKIADPFLLSKGLGGTASSIGAVEVIVEDDGEWLVNPLILDNDSYPKHHILKF
jgi:hypothetical protein